MPQICTEETCTQRQSEKKGFLFSFVWEERIRFFIVKKFVGKLKNWNCYLFMKCNGKLIGGRN